MRVGRRAVAGLVLLAALWPAVGRAEEPPSTTLPPDTTVAPATTLPPETTAPPETTVVEEEAPPPTVAPEPETAEPEGWPRTLEVTPHNNLVHDQSVLLRGRGWPPHQGGMGAAQCVTGITDTRGCGSVRFYDVDAAGNFRGRYTVSVILETAIGTFDCRIEQCVLGANYTPSAAGARFVELHFDPAGPDPTRRTGVDVDPDTNLVDGQEVTVTGDGFEVVEPGFGGFADIVQCREPAVDFEADCDQSTWGGGFVDLDGHLEETVSLEAILRLAGGATHDCRTGGCVLLVRDYDEPWAEAALLPLGFDPGGALRPPPTLVADPTTDLVDGDWIEVTGSDWEEGIVYLFLCAAGATSYDDCDPETFHDADVTVDGDVSTMVNVRTRLLVNTGEELDCRVDACSLVATQDESFHRLVEVPLTYDPTGGLVDITISVTPNADLQDGDVVHISGEGRGDGQMIAAQCLAGAKTFAQCDFDTANGVGGGDDGLIGLFNRRDPTLEPFEAPFEVHRVLHLNDGQRVDCALRPCAVVVGEDYLLDVAGRAALDFARAPATVDPITATPTFTG